MFFCLVIIAANSDNIQMYPDYLISEIYLRNGYEQYKDDNYKEALSLVNIALSFSNNSSDAVFIRAVSERNLKIANSTISNLMDAIIIDNWHYFNEITARIYLSKFMYLDGNVEEAYLNLLPFIKELSGNSYFTELFIRISLSLGKDEQAAMTAANRILVDPYDNYAQQILVLYDQEWIEKANEMLHNGDPSHYFSKTVVQTLISYGGANCRFLRELYLVRWGNDRFYKISTICDSIDKAVKLLPELYFNNIIIDYNELKWIYKILENDSESVRVLSAKFDYSSKNG